jgi:hypothetical protein
MTELKRDEKHSERPFFKTAVQTQASFHIKHEFTPRGEHVPQG